MMHLNTHFFRLSAILLSVLFSGCTHYFYAPSLPLSPGFQERGDVMLMAGGGVQDHSSGWEMKGGYAFSNHFFGALEAGFFEGSEYLGNDGKGRFLGAAGGWYHLYERSQRIGWLFSAHLALQQSRAENIFSEENYVTGVGPVYLGQTDMRFRKYYLEPGVALLSRYVQLHASLRLGALRYFELDSDLTPPFGVVLEGFPELDRVYSVIEPGLSLNFGRRNGQFQLKWVQVGRKYPFSVAESSIGLTWVLYPNRFFQ